MVRYKVKYKNIAPHVKEEFIHNFNCYIGVSLNNPLFQGKGLPTLLRWVSSKYPFCTIIISDYLDRLNQKIFNEEITLQRAIDTSLTMGKRIEHSIQNCITDLQIENITTNLWLNYYEQNEVQIIKHKLYNQLDEKSDFKTSINQSAIEYLKKKSASTCFCNERNIGLSIEYIIEELAVFSYLIQTGARVQLYPGTQLPILKKIANKEIILSESNLGQGIYVDLTVKKIGK